MVEQKAREEQAAKQQERKRLIRNLLNRGIFAKMEQVGGTPHVWVRPAFYELDFDDKQAFISVVAAYYYVDRPEDPIKLVTLKDARTGKRVGSFSQTSGLDLD